MLARLLVLFSALLIASCAGQPSSTSYSPKKPSFQTTYNPLEERVSRLIGMDYGKLVLDLNLLDITPHTHTDCRTPISFLSLHNQQEHTPHYEQRITQLEQLLNKKYEFKESLMRNVNRAADHKIGQLRTLIQTTPIGIRKLQRSASYNNISQGGQFLPFDPTQSTYGMPLSDKLRYLDSVSQIVQALPLIKPMEDFRVSSHFGPRRNPISRRWTQHRGIDLVGKPKHFAKVHSTARGTVTYAGRFSSYGNTVEIDHGFGMSTRYAHLKRIYVKKGDWVDASEIIGIQGNTGRSRGVHLHYEIRFRNKPYNPELFLRLSDSPSCRVLPVKRTITPKILKYRL